jgi:hypothetical protein
MATVNQSEFAKILGYSRAAVTQFKKAGRLVMTEDGLVDVEASKLRIEETADPNRDDVVRRHAENRKSEIKVEGTETSFQASRALREHYLALQEKAAYEKNIGQLVERSEVDHNWAEVATILRTQFEKIPDVLSAELAVETDPNRIHAMLVENIEHALEQASEKIRLSQ